MTRLSIAPRKALAVLLALALVLSVLPGMAVFAAETADSTSDETVWVLQEDYEDSALGATVDNGTVIADDGNQVMQIVDTAADATQKVRYSFDAQSSGVVYFGFAYKFNTIYEDSDCLSFGIASKTDTGKDASSSDGRILQIKMESGRIRYRSGDASDYTDYSVDGTAWVTIEIALDLDNSVCDIYVNGVLALEGQSFGLKSSGTALTGVDCLAFFTDKATLADASIDNICVYTLPESEESDTYDIPEPAEGKTPADVISFVYSEEEAGSCTAMNNDSQVYVTGSTWKVTTPAEPTGGKSVYEVDSADLQAGYSDENIYAAYDADGVLGVVFYCPVDGYKTANTSYTRSELREMLDPDDKCTNWTYQGTHILRTEQAVTAVPASGKVYTSQIHGIAQNGDNENPLVKVQYAYDADKGTGAIKVYMKNGTSSSAADIVYTFSVPVDLGQKYTTEIMVVDGVVFVTIGTLVDGEMYTETFRHDFVEIDPLWTDILYYFKLGNYCQDSTDLEGYSVVWVYDSYLNHSDSSVPVDLESLTMDSTQLTLHPGERVGLTYSFLPITATNTDVTWSVIEGQDIVAVDANGYVTAVQEGTAVVQATSTVDPSITAVCTITVEPAQETASELLYENDFNDGTDLETDFDQTGDDPVDVTISASENATVTLADGVITITDTDNASCGKFSVVFPEQTSTTTIVFKLRIDEIGINKSGSTSCGRMYAYAGSGDAFTDSSTELNRIRSYADGSYPSFSNCRYQFTSAYQDADQNADYAAFTVGEWVEVVMVVTPNDGSAKANTTDFYIDGYPVALGVSNRNTLDYVNRLDIQSGTGDTISFSIDDVQIYSGDASPEADTSTLPDSITLINVPQYMAVQGSAKAEVEVSPSGSYSGVVYSVVDGDAVVISSDGYITAVKAGTATIRATCDEDGSVYDEAQITVTEEFVSVTGIDLGVSSISIGEGETYQLSPVVSPDDATETGVKYEIVSGSDYISLTSDGLITGTALGSAVVKVSSLSATDVYALLDVSVVYTGQDGDVIYEDDFDTGVLNTDDWTASTPNYTSVTVSDGVMTISDGSPSGQPKVTLTFTPVNGDITIQFQLKIDGETEAQSGTVSTDYTNIRIAYGTGTITTASNEGFVIRSNSSKQLTYYAPSGSSDYTVAVGDYDTSEWITVTLVAHIDPDGPDTTDVYINGVLYAEGTPNKVDYEVIDKLCFSADSTRYSQYQIQNLVITYGSYTSSDTSTDPEETDPVDPSTEATDPSEESTDPSTEATGTTDDGTSSGSDDSESPKTGDQFSWVSGTLLLAVSMCGIVWLNARFGKRRSRK